MTEAVLPFEPAPGGQAGVAAGTEAGASASPAADAPLVIEPSMVDCAHAAAQLPHAELSAGALLKMAREAAGLHIAALAVLLKVPVKKLEALEANHFDALPDAVFVRALASSVCRTLKIDPAAVLAKLPQSNQPRLAYEETVTHIPFPASAAANAGMQSLQVSRPLMWSVGLLVVGALAIGLMPSLPEVTRHWQNAKKTLTDGLDNASPVNQTPSSLALEDKPRTLVTETQPVVGAPAVSAALTAPDPLASSSQADAAVGIPAMSVLQADAGAAPVAQRQPATGIVVFKALAESWVEVTDKTGTVALRRTLAAGESVGATGPLPLTVVVGRANVTQVQVRGKAFDMQTLTKDNVARFEVK